MKIQEEDLSKEMVLLVIMFLKTKQGISTF